MLSDYYFMYYIVIQYDSSFIIVNFFPLCSYYYSSCFCIYAFLIKIIAKYVWLYTVFLR